MSFEMNFLKIGFVCRVSSSSSGNFDRPDPLKALSRFSFALKPLPLFPGETGGEDEDAPVEAVTAGGKDAEDPLKPRRDARSTEGEDCPEVESGGIALLFFRDTLGEAELETVATEEETREE